MWNLKFWGTANLLLESQTARISNEFLLTNGP